MIRYTLHCTGGHEFEAWFSDSASYDAQAAARQIVCPACGSDRVAKALMTPNVVSSRRASAKLQPEEKAAVPPELMEAARTVRRYVEENAEYVGPRFADEARKIHFEEAESRGIYGEATADDVKLLHEEGVECFPLPRLPEDHN
jgi:hypothetical protein